MLYLSEVVRPSELGLQLIFPPQEDDPEVLWAHVSELTDPTPWLVGGELVLTTGMALFEDADDTLQYCRNLVEAEIVALGISTGASLPHGRLPDQLVDAAKQTGLPLVHVPENTPLQRVVRHVSDALSEDNSQQLERALVAQRQLSEAAASQDGVVSVLRVLDANTGFSSAVYDATLNLITTTSATTQDVFNSHRDEVRRHMRERIHWSVTTVEGQSYSVITPLYAARNLRGIFVTVKYGPLSQHDQAILSTVFSLLRVLLELRHTAMLENRQTRERVVDALLNHQLGPVAAALQLARADIEAKTIQCLLLPPSTTEIQLNGVLSDLGAKDSHALTKKREKDVVVLICDPEEETADALIRTITDLGIAHAGLGSAVKVENARLSLRQAQKAWELAHERQEGLIVFPELESYKALLLLGDHVSRSALADAVLSSLDAHDETHKSSLVDVLYAYFNAVGNIEVAAAELGIHRHTMRGRLSKISELTRRNFKNAPDVLELWLACEIRQVEYNL